MLEQRGAVAVEPREWLIYSSAQGAWWGPNRSGYRQDFRNAGLYTRTEAEEIAQAELGKRDLMISLSKALMVAEGAMMQPTVATYFIELMKRPS